MFHLAAIDWASLSAVTNIVIAGLGIILWASGKISELGKLPDRLTIVENTIKNEIKPDIREMRKDIHTISLAVARLEALYKQR